MESTLLERALRYTLFWRITVRLLLDVCLLAMSVGGMFGSGFVAQDSDTRGTFGFSFLSSAYVAVGQ